MKRIIDSRARKMSVEYTAPQVRMHARDMLLEMGALLARGASVKTQINSIALATRLSAGRIKRYFYEEVQRVPADEYLTIQAWSQRLKARLGKLEEQYSAARAALLEQSEGDPVVGALVAPDVGEEVDRALMPRRARR
jgi:hypothetical protein